MRIDLHVHSRFSRDSGATLEDLVARAKSIGMDRIALTDHNTVEGAFLLQQAEPELTIAGEEVRSTEGDIIGLFLTEQIPGGKSPENTLDAIHDIGGLTYIAHPFDLARAHFSPARIIELADRIDIIETYNTWASDEDNEAARRIAVMLGKVVATGGDAHAARELGHSWMEIDPYDGPEDFLGKLRHARHVVAQRRIARTPKPSHRPSGSAATSHPD